MNKQEKQNLIWASGFYLVKNLPKNFDKWSEKKLDKFLSDNAWEFFEFCEPHFIWEQIDSLAWSVNQHYISKE
tara:strand:+ start:249 stop:467 length:219 start_codon:yes stop_codon:yes gene_type:complete